MNKKNFLSIVLLSSCLGINAQSAWFGGVYTNSNSGIASAVMAWGSYFINEGINSLTDSDSPLFTYIIRKTKCYRFTKRNVPKHKTKRLRYRCPPEPYSNSVRTDFFSYSNATILESQQINTSIWCKNIKETCYLSPISYYDTFRVLLQELLGLSAWLVFSKPDKLRTLLRGFHLHLLDWLRLPLPDSGCIWCVPNLQWNHRK